MSALSLDKGVHVIACLSDGSSIRATQRITGVEKKTIGKLLLAVGEGCARVHDRIMRDLDVISIQLDEQHSYVHTRQVTYLRRIRRAQQNNESMPAPAPVDRGEQWTFIAFAVAPRAIISYLVGKRTADNAQKFIRDLKRRLKVQPRIDADAPSVVPTIASDGFDGYPEAVSLAFGKDVQFGQLVKQYEMRKIKNKKGVIVGEHRANYKGAVKVALTSDIDERDINTSYVERSNLTARMSMRRFVRRTNSFSKSLRHHVAAVSMHVAYYNLARVHETLRTTPAMALGVTDHVWELDELVATALQEPEPPPLLDEADLDTGAAPISAHEAGRRKPGPGRGSLI